MFKSILKWVQILLAIIGLIAILAWFFDPSKAMYLYKEVHSIESLANSKINNGRSGRDCRRIHVHKKINYPKDYTNCIKKMKLNKIIHEGNTIGIYRCESSKVVKEMMLYTTTGDMHCSVATFYKKDNIPIGEAYKHELPYR